MLVLWCFIIYSQTHSPDTKRQMQRHMQEVVKGEFSVYPFSCDMPSLGVQKLLLRCISQPGTFVCLSLPDKPTHKQTRRRHSCGTENQVSVRTSQRQHLTERVQHSLSSCKEQNAVHLPATACRGRQHAQGLRSQHQSAVTIQPTSTSFPTSALGVKHDKHLYARRLRTCAICIVNIIYSK